MLHGTSGRGKSGTDSGPHTAQRRRATGGRGRNSRKRLAAADTARLPTHGVCAHGPDHCHFTRTRHTAQHFTIRGPDDGEFVGRKARRARWPQSLYTYCRRNDSAVATTLHGALESDGGPHSQRTLMSHFLLEAAAILGQPSLRAVATLYEEIAALWIEVRRSVALKLLPTTICDALDGILQLETRPSGRLRGCSHDYQPSLSVHSYKHLLGTHCVTAALRNLVHYYTGEVMSEAMIFGLGSGLNFTYIRRPGSNFFLTMGRGTEIETLFADLVNIDLDCVLFRERGPAWQFVQELISEQHPVMVDTDMFHLPYMIQSHI